ncbi:MAG: hypothetical protein IPO86_08550 [Saprospiraceae bacterium]|nr:hypothetical protein [Saprospiraceae bacterium]
MTNYKETSLWRASFSNENEMCNRLKVAFDSFREKAGLLANEIYKDQPSLTVHDLTHLDALWIMGSLITGDGFEITPTEGFVLGGAFLVHDLAMTISAFPKGRDEFKKLPQWDDTIFTVLKKNKGYANYELNQADINLRIEEETMQILLRDLHAIKAKELCCKSSG